ncbi:glutathione S-transferase C-terminal domain-containing protein, partial [Klebsiella pneumoniae]|nr:glutathione S-transferase C-terminal domain-containing protein [Klebsiella pneumoniae]
GDQSRAAIAPASHDPAFALYQQFLHLGEAGLGANIQTVVVSNFIAPEAERDNWGARWALGQFHSRMKLVKRQLARAPFMAGDRFTAADIS